MQIAMYYEEIIHCIAMAIDKRKQLFKDATEYKVEIPIISTVTIAGNRVLLCICICFRWLHVRDTGTTMV